MIALFLFFLYYYIYNERDTKEIYCSFSESETTVSTRNFDRLP